MSRSRSHSPRGGSLGRRSSTSKRSRDSRGGSSSKKEYNLFVVNLTGSTTEEEILKLYNRYGTVAKCKLIKDQDTGYNVTILALNIRNTALSLLPPKLKQN